MKTTIVTYGDLFTLYTSTATKLTELRESLKLKAPTPVDMKVIKSYNGLLKFILGTVAIGLARSVPAVADEACTLRSSDPFEFGIGCLLMGRINRQWTLPVGLIGGYDRFPDIVDVAASIQAAEARQAERREQKMNAYAHRVNLMPVMPGSRLAEVTQRMATIQGATRRNDQQQVGLDSSGGFVVSP